MIASTDKFIIRRLKPKDWQELYKIFDDFAKGKYWMYDYPVSLERENIINLTLAFCLQGTFFGVFTPDETRMMGYISFDGEGGEYEMGYSFHSDFHGKGIAYLSCIEAMEYIMREYVVRKFTAGTAINNLPSVKLLQRLGFVKLGEETLAFHKDESGSPIYFTGGVYEKEC